MPVKQRVVEHIIPKKLALIDRVWTNADQSKTTQTYMARLWQPAVKRYSFIKLESTSVHNAKQECFEHWTKHAGDIKDGRDIGSYHRKLRTFIDEFLEIQRSRARNKQITEKRAQVIGHHLVSLEKFWASESKPTLDELSRLYEIKWQNYRSVQKAEKTGKILSARYRNNETNSHKQFFRWCETERYSSRIPKVKDLKVKRTNAPFPAEYYPKLLSVTRESIKNGRNPRIRYEHMNYRYVILLMSGIGCRVLECKNLRWTDIDVRKNGIFLYLHGKDKERTIRIPDRVYGHLMDLRKYKDEHHPNYNEEDYPHIFNTWLSPTATNHYAGEVRRRWMAATGMPNPDDYELVCFRHKFITDALNNGAHSLTIASYCGTSQKMIEDTYSGLVDTQVYDLVFKNTPDDALTRNETPKWLNLSSNG